MPPELRWPICHTPAQALQPCSLVVIDTNIVLDLLVFAAPTAQPLRHVLASAQLHWIATTAMRDELACVLHYPHLQQRLQFYQLSVESVLAAFDAQVRTVVAPGRAPYVCRDADDQKFIDLAFTHRAILMSKDKAVLCMKKRLERHGATAVAAIVFEHHH